MQENNNDNKNLVFFLRHGDRGDRSQESYERQKLEKEYDCHLTDLGKYQAQEAGKHIQDMIKKTGKDIKQVKLVASPFLRCCMTAENVSVGLGLPVMNNEIVVDNGVCECLTSDILDHSPFEQGLNIREGEQQIKKYCNIKLNDSNQDANKPKFPEGPNETYTYERLFNNFKRITQEFSENVKNDPQYQNTALIIVSHGGCVAGLLNTLGIFDPEISYPICNINGFLLQNDQELSKDNLPTILCKQYQEHLPAAETNYLRFKQGKGI